MVYTWISIHWKFLGETLPKIIQHYLERVKITTRWTRATHLQLDASLSELFAPKRKRTFHKRNGANTIYACTAIPPPISTILYRKQITYLIKHFRVADIQHSVYIWLLLVLLFCSLIAHLRNCTCNDDFCFCFVSAAVKLFGSRTSNQIRTKRDPTESAIHTTMNIFVPHCNWWNREQDSSKGRTFFLPCFSSLPCLLCEFWE